MRLLVLELGHPVQFAHVGMAAHDIAELRMFLDIGLQEDRRLLRIKSAGEIQRDTVTQVGLQFFRILRHGDAVKIGNKCDHLVFILVRDKFAEGADIVS